MGDPCAGNTAAGVPRVSHRLPPPFFGSPHLTMTRGAQLLASTNAMAMRGQFADLPCMCNAALCSSFFMSNTEWDASAFAALIREMGARNESAFSNVDGETVIDVPAQALRGRAGSAGKTFSGYFDLLNGKIRLECAEELGFWLEIDIGAIPGLASAPGGHDASAARDDFVRSVQE